MTRLLAVVLLASSCQVPSQRPPANASDCLGARETFRATLVDLAQKALDDANHDCRPSCEQRGATLIELGAHALALATRLEDNRSFVSLPRPPASAGEAVVVAHERVVVAQHRWRGCGGR